MPRILAPIDVTGAITQTTEVLTDQSVIALDASKGNYFTVTLGGNRQLGTPTNPSDGQRIIIAVTQDGTGSRTLSYSAAWQFTSALPQPVLPTAPGATAYLAFLYIAATSSWLLLASLPGSSSTATAALVPAVVVLSQSGGSVAVNAALGNVFTLTLTASGWTIANPTNPADGQVIRFRLAQDVSGSRTVTWGSAYDWGTGNPAPNLTAAGSKVDIVGFEYNAALSKWMYLSAPFPQGF